MTTSKVDILIDADPLVYRVGFSLEKRVYYVTYRNVDPASPDYPNNDAEYVAKFWSAKNRDAWLELMNIHPDEYAVELVSVPIKDKAIVYGRVKQSIADIIKECGLYLYESDEIIGEVKLFLSGSKNFRNELATITKYKGSRDKSVRPFHYENIRGYLCGAYGATISDGIEADDAVSIAQWNGEGKTIIATIDKDLLNVPGKHYNYHHKMAQTVTRKQAKLRFYHQLLTGDRTDDIPGLKGVGPVAANKLLPGWLPEEEMYRRVLVAYSDNMEEYPLHHLPYGNPESSLLENARLLHMMRREDELWNPPGIPNGSIKGFLENLPPRESDE